MNIQVQKILRQAPYLTKQNLGLVLGKEGEDLNYWVKRLIDTELIFPLKKGLYISSLYKESLIQSSDKESYREYLANILRTPSYLSMEYMLSIYSLIPEGAYAFTSITPKISRNYNTSAGKFVYYKQKARLFNWEDAYEIKSFKDKNIKRATPAKAAFDWLYYQPEKRLSEKFLVQESRFNWEALSGKDKKSFRRVVAFSESGKMNRLLQVLEKNNLI